MRSSRRSSTWWRRGTCTTSSRYLHDFFLILVLYYSFSRTECPCPKSYSGRECYDKDVHWNVCDFDIRIVAGVRALFVRFRFIFYFISGVLFYFVPGVLIFIPDDSTCYNSETAIKHLRDCYTTSTPETEPQIHHSGR